MKRILYLGTLFLFTNGLFAQHCPFDFAGIIVLRIHTKADTSIIPNLRITLLDSLGITVMTDIWDGNKSYKDTLKLWQNPSRTSFTGYIDNNNPADPARIRFPFAKDNYVLVCSAHFPAKKYKIKIEDIDGQNNGGYFKTIIVQATNEDVYPLCGTYNKEEYPESSQNKYKPIDIELTDK